MKSLFQRDSIHVRAAHAAQAKYLFFGTSGGDVFAPRAFRQQQVTLRFGLLDVPPEKSEAATSSGAALGSARITASRNCFLMLAMSSIVNVSCASQRPS